MKNISRLVCMIIALGIGFSSISAVCYASSSDDVKSDDFSYVVKQELKKCDGEERIAYEISLDDIGIKSHTGIDSAEKKVAASKSSVYDGLYGYKDMALRSNSAARREMYKNLYEMCAEFDSSKTDILPEKVTGIGDCYIIDAIETGLTTDEMVETYFTFRNDFPQYYWLSNVALFAPGYFVVSVYEEFASYSSRLFYGSLVNRHIDTIIESAGGLSRYEKVLFAHDYICNLTTYAVDDNGYIISNGITHSIVGVFQKGMSVCEGYAKALQLVLNRLGIENVYVTGKSGEDNNWENHAWNMVRMDNGEYYYIDATWDDLDFVTEETDIDNYEHEEVFDIYYEYFMVKADEFLTTHIPDKSTGSGLDFLYDLPAASENDNYSFYKQERVYIADQSTESIFSAIRNAIESVVLDGRAVGHICFDSSLGEDFVSSVCLDYIDIPLYTLECFEGQDYRFCIYNFSDNTVSFTVYMNENTPREDRIVTLQKSGEVVGSFYTLTGAMEAMEDGGDYTVTVKGDTYVYPGVTLPESGIVNIIGIPQPDSEDGQYYYPDLNLFDDITFGCDLYFETLRFYGVPYDGKSSIVYINYGKTLTSEDGFYQNVKTRKINFRPSKDISGDCKVDSSDLLMLQQLILGTATSDTLTRKYADVDKDGVIGSSDLLMLQQFILGLV